MNAFHACLIILGVVLCSSPANAQRADLAFPLKEAQQALSQGDYAKAFTEYQRYAEEQNNPLAQFTLGLFYQYGWGRAVDPIAACRWYEQAATGKIPAAQHFLGDCLVKGIHRPADPAQAAYWYEQAAQSGHLLSYCSLAALYLSGQGVPKDPPKGLALCRGVAEQGSVPAMLRLGRFLLEGEDAIRDYGAAYAWFEQAAQRGVAEGQYFLGVMNRDGLGRPADPELARQWFETAAAQGYVLAYFPTAVLYFNAPLDPTTQQPQAENLAKAYLWLSATAQRSKDFGEFIKAAGMLNKVKALMPATWLPTLDEKVAHHLAEHPPQ